MNSTGLLHLQVDDLLRSSGSVGSKSAKWGASVVLFTDKDRTAHLTQSLAHRYEGKIAFGEVQGANKQLAGTYNVTRSIPHVEQDLPNPRLAASQTPDIVLQLMFEIVFCTVNSAMQSKSLH